MRFGLIGYGLWGKHHAQLIAKAEGLELAAIACSDDETRAAAEADFPGIPVYKGYAGLLENPDVEAVDVVVPNHLHTEVGVAVLDAGKDMLIEKPMALTVEGCDRMIEAAKRNGRQISVAHQFRLSHQWGMIKKIIAAGDIGDPMYGLVSLFRFPYRPGSGGWRFEPDQVGSWTLEEPVHFFDNLMWFFDTWGDPTSVVSFGNSKTGKPGMNDNFTTVVRWPNGLYGVVTQTLAGFEHHHVMEVVGREGSIRTWWSGTMDRTMNPTFELKVQRRDRAQCEVVNVPVSGEVFELEEQLKRVAAAFREGRTIVSGEEARKRILVCIEAERSLAEGRELSLEF